MGVIQEFGPLLLQRAWGSRACFGALMDIFVPPLTLVALLLGVGTLLSMLDSSPWLLLAWCSADAALILYVFSALALTRSSRTVYLSLFMTPLFIIWKIILYASLPFGKAGKSWVRTQRNREAIK